MMFPCLLATSLLLACVEAQKGVATADELGLGQLYISKADRVKLELAYEANLNPPVLRVGNVLKLESLRTLVVVRLAPEKEMDAFVLLVQVVDNVIILCRSHEEDCLLPPGELPWLVDPLLVSRTGLAVTIIHPEHGNDVISP